MSTTLRACGLVSFLLLLALASNAHRPSSWIYLQPSAQGTYADENRLVGLGFDYRGRFAFFSLVVADEADVERIRAECCPVCRVAPFDTYQPSDELWIVEAGPDMSDQVSALIPNAVALKESASPGRTSFIIRDKKSLSFISLLANVTLIPVPLESVILPDFSSNPIKTSFAAGMIKAEPAITQIVGEVNPELVEKHDVHLSNYLTRLSTSTVAVEAQEWISQYYASLGLSVKTESFRNGYSSNVIAELPGAGDPSQIVIIGAHYDSRATSLSNTAQRAPGADDNGSGTAAVLELARVFAQTNVRFNYTIRFCSWSGEEQGLYGSRAYAQKAKKEGQKIIAALNADMIGYRKRNTPLTMALDSRYVTSWLVEAVAKVANIYVPQLNVGYNSGCCSDQQSFYEQGFPAAGYFETTGSTVDYPAYHQSTDLPQNLDFEQVGLITKAIAAAIASFAQPL